MPCLDQQQNSIDCNDPDCTYGDCTDQSTTLLQQVQAAQAGTPTGSTSPIAVASGSNGSGGPGIISSILNFVPSVVNRVIPPTQSTSGLVLRINSQGQQQYYNTQTGQFVGGPVNSSGLGSFFSGGSGLLLVVVAAAVAFFVFYRRK